MIEMAGIRVYYGKKEILHSISYRFESGKIYAVLGKNGSGKSTLLRTAAGLIKPASGTLALNGQPISTLSSLSRARQIAYLPQTRENTQMTAFQLIRCARYPYRGTIKQAEEEAFLSDILSRCGVTEFAHSDVTTLSGGQRQKVYLAMLSAQDTDNRLLDEPTVSLDIGSQLETWTRCRQWAEEGKTIVVATHDIQQALFYADEIILLQEGRISASGTADVLLGSGKLESAFSVYISRIDDTRIWIGQKECVK